MAIVEEVDNSKNPSGNGAFSIFSLNHNLSDAPLNDDLPNVSLKIDKVNVLEELPKAIARLLFSTFLEPFKGFSDILKLFIKLIVGIFFMLILPTVLLGVALFLLPFTLIGLVSTVVLLPLNLLFCGLAVISSILLRNPVPAILTLLLTFGPLLGVALIGACLALAAISFLAGLVITSLSLIILPIQLITRSIATMAGKCCSDTEKTENPSSFSIFPKKPSKSGKENQNQDQDLDEENHFDLAG